MYLTNAHDASLFFALFGIYQLRRAGDAAEQPRRTDNRS